MMIMWVLSCQDTGSAGAAESTWHISTGKSHPHLSDESFGFLQWCHAAEHFVLVVREEQHHVGPPGSRRHPEDPQAAAQHQ